MPKHCRVGDVIDATRQHALPLAFVVDADLQSKKVGHDGEGGRYNKVRGFKEGSL